MLSFKNTREVRETLSCASCFSMHFSRVLKKFPRAYVAHVVICKAREIIRILTKRAWNYFLISLVTIWLPILISGHWRCNRRSQEPITAVTAKGAARPLSPMGVWGHAPAEKNWNLEARKCDFQHSGHRKACCWWVFLLTTKLSRALQFFGLGSVLPAFL